MKGYDGDQGKGLQPYNQFGDNRGKDNKSRAFKLLLPRILSKMNNHHAVLDVGAGNGRLSAILARKFDKVVALEPYDEQHKNFVHPHVSFVKKTFEEFESNEKFDLILFWGVFYLMPNYERALSKAASLCNELIVIGDDEKRRFDRYKDENIKIRYDLSRVMKNSGLKEVDEFFNKHYRITLIKS